MDVSPTNNIGSPSSPTRLGLIYDAFALDYGDSYGEGRDSRGGGSGAVPITSLSLPPPFRREVQRTRQMHRRPQVPSVAQRQPPPASATEVHSLNNTSLEAGLGPGSVPLSSSGVVSTSQQQSVMSSFHIPQAGSVIPLVSSPLATGLTSAEAASAAAASAGTRVSSTSLPPSDSTRPDALMISIPDNKVLGGRSGSTSGIKSGRRGRSSSRGSSGGSARRIMGGSVKRKRSSSNQRASIPAWRRRKMGGNGLVNTVGRPFAAKARKLLYLFWSRDCAKRNLDTYVTTADEIRKGFEKISDQILDGVWTSGKQSSVSKALHRLEGVTWTLVRECEVVFEIGATTLSLVCEEIAQTWYHALRALLPLHSKRFRYLKTPSIVHWEVTYRKKRTAPRFEQGSLREIAATKVFDLVVAADEEEGIDSGFRDAMSKVSSHQTGVGKEAGESTRDSFLGDGGSKKGGELSTEVVHMEEILNLCARSALRFRAAAEKLYISHLKGTIQLSENALDALARSAATAIASAESNALLCSEHASAFEDDLADKISSERDVLVSENESEKVQEELRVRNLVETARAQFEEKIKKKTKPKSISKSKTAKPADAGGNAEKGQQNESNHSAEKKWDKDEDGIGGVQEHSERENPEKEREALVVSPPLSALPDAGMPGNEILSNSLDDVVADFESSANPTVLETTFGPGEFGLELVNGLHGNVIIGDWKKGGQADRLHGTKLENGMVLESIAGVDVTVLRLEQIVALMNTSTRPVVLRWKRANAAAEHEHNYVAGSGGIVGEGAILDDLDFDLRNPLYDEAGVEEAPVFEQTMSGVERVKMGRELQGAFF